LFVIKFNLTKILCIIISPLVRVGELYKLYILVVELYNVLPILLVAFYTSPFMLNTNFRSTKKCFYYSPPGKNHKYKYITLKNKIKHTMLYIVRIYITVKIHQLRLVKRYIIHPLIPNSYTYLFS